MRVAGIIAEYNPFHEGHRYLFTKICEELGEDTAVFVIMSGDFVQRGAPALIDRADRTSAVLQCGADLVFELPFTFATGSADRFASGAVDSLIASGVITDLYFGAEHDSLSDLTRIASIDLETIPEFKDSLDQLQKNGLSYAAAWEQAAIAVFPTLGMEDFSETYHMIIGEPNNILAISYLRRLLSKKSSITPHLVHRKDSYHNEQLNEGKLPSATAVRQEVMNNYLSQDKGSFLRSLSSLSDYVPIPMLAEMLHSWNGITCPMGQEDLIRVALPILRSTSADKLAMTAHMGEQLASHIKNSIGSMHFDNKRSVESSFAEAVKTKCFPYSRIMRALSSLVVGQTTEDLISLNEPKYLRLLGFSERGRMVLKDMRKNAILPILSRTSDALHFQKDPLFARMNALDLTSHDWWTMTSRETWEEDYHFEVIQFKRNKIYRK
ncbi:MAG: nucleotidyltransferase family protein [Clostridiales bacterium]|nr:nucleotidyltransferase family protein [Clostridiales bacterium]